MFHCGQYSSQNIRTEVKRIVDSCKFCAGKKPLPKKQHKESIYSFLFGERMQVDASEIAHESAKRLRKNGFRYILTLLDCVSKKGKAWPLKTLEAQEIYPLLETYFKSVFTPDILQSDNHRQFKNELLKELEERMGYKHIFGKANTPEHQGQVEVFNKTVKRRLFSWVRVNWGEEADEHWHDKGLEAALDGYNADVHRSTHIPPDMWHLGRMKTPAQRSQHQVAIHSLNYLVADRSDNLNWATLEQQAKEGAFSAAAVTLHLEKNDIIHREALSWTAKTQIANQLRKAGTRFTSLAIPVVGQKVTFRRPVRDPKKFKAQNPVALPNVEGTIIAISVVGMSYYVEWKDENNKTRHSCLFYDEFETGLRDDVTRLETTRIISWADIKMYMREFSFIVKVSWKNTIALKK
jgi:hypothetical protein